MAFLTLLGKCSVSFSKIRSQADGDPLQSLRPQVEGLERRKFKYKEKGKCYKNLLKYKINQFIQMQGEKIEKLGRRLNGPAVLSGHLTEAPSSDE